MTDTRKSILGWAAPADFAENMRHSDKSFLDKPHLSICDEAVAGAARLKMGFRVTVISCLHIPGICFILVSGFVVNTPVQEELQ